MTPRKLTDIKDFSKIWDNYEVKYRFPIKSVMCIETVVQLRFVEGAI